MRGPTSLEDTVLSWPSQGSLVGQQLRGCEVTEGMVGKAARLSQVSLCPKVLSLELSVVLASHLI